MTTDQPEADLEKCRAENTDLHAEIADVRARLADAERRAPLTTGPGTLTLRSLDGATVELDAQALPAGTVVILQFRGHATLEQLDNARRLLAERLGDAAAAPFVIVDEQWRIWPITITEPRPEERATFTIRHTGETFTIRPTGETFTIRPTGETDDVTVALRGLGRCTICRHDIPSGSFVVFWPIGDPAETSVAGWTHESCARPQNPARPALNADQTRARS